MRRKLRNSVVFFLCLVGLQQGLFWAGQQQSAFRIQKELILEKDIDPAVFFYTESEQALKAEKKLRSSLKGVDWNTYIE